MKRVKFNPKLAFSKNEKAFFKPQRQQNFTIQYFITRHK